MPPEHEQRPGQGALPTNTNNNDQPTDAVPSPQQFVWEGLWSGLHAAGYREGERFELTAIDDDRRLETLVVALDQQQLASVAFPWLMQRHGRANLYLGSNPLNGCPQGARPGDGDVVALRGLLLDADPADTSPGARAAAAALAQDIRQLVERELGLRPALIDSGRGQQVWLRHEACHPSDERARALRKRLLYCLGAFLDREGAKVDRQVHNPSRLMRLPGGINRKTGDWARVLEPGDERVVGLAALEALVARLEQSVAQTRPAGPLRQAQSASLDHEALNPVEVLAGVPEGERDTTLFRYACRLRGKGLRREEAELLVLEAAENCDPPFPEAEARAKVASAWRYDVDPGQDDAALDAAVALLEQLPGRAENDVGAAFEPGALAAMRLVRDGRPPDWARFRGAMRELSVSWRDLERALRANGVTAEQEAATPTGGGQPENAAGRLVALASKAYLFHAPDMTPYAAIPIDGHLENWPLRSKRFRTWLMREYHQEEDSAPSSSAVADALGVLEGRACFDGQELPVFMRVAQHEGKVYLDLADSTWRAIEVDKDGWRLCPNPPVRFRRASGMLALPVPVAGGSVDELRPLVNMPGDDAWRLFVAWLLAAIGGRGPFPILVLQGEQGSAKSTTARVARALVDPSSAMLRTVSRNERDLAIAANNGFVIAFDNLSGLTHRTSDALCRLSTGGGFSTRQLYTDGDEVIFDAMRPVVLNGIDAILTRPDLADRALVLHLPTLPEEQRRLESDLSAQLSAVLPRVLGALLTAVCHALRNVPGVVLARLPRMADFARWIVAAEPGLGWPQGSFLASYERNRREAITSGIECDAVAEAITCLLEQAGSWQGPAGHLLTVLEQYASGGSRDRSWPRTPQALANRLLRLAPVLRGVGIKVTKLPREPKTGRRGWGLSLIAAGQTPPPVC